MNIETLSYNKRQIIHIEEKIADYYDGRLGLYNLVSDLLNLTNLLKEVSNDWVRALVGQINGIDCLFAVIEFRKREFTDEDQKKVDAYIATIESMINDYKKEYKLDEFDEELEEYKLLYPEDDDIKW